MILHTPKEKLGIKVHPSYTDALFPLRVKVRHLTVHLLVIFFFSLLSLQTILQSLMKAQGSHV